MSDAERLSEADQETLAVKIHAAIASGQGIVPPSEEIDYSFADAYKIRRKLVDRLIADGGRPKGHKIGFTSKAMQEMYGMSGPDFGQLLDSMFVPEGEPLPIGQLSDTRVEPELAFEMAEPLRGPGVTMAEVLAKTRLIYPAIEVIDSRVGAMRAKAVDSIADNAGAGKVVLARRGVAPDAHDWAALKIALTVDGETLSGQGGDVMGHPAEAVAWLANKLSEIDGLGGMIEAGDIVMSGSCTRSMAVAPGSHLAAYFGPLGGLTIDFV